MWTCGKCGAKVESVFQICWACGRAKDGTEAEAPREAAPPRHGAVVRFKTFISGFESWEQLFGQAAEYATRLGPDRLINISHSEDSNEGVVTVWYWGE
jgi:hypothetical protein